AGATRQPDLARPGHRRADPGDPAGAHHLPVRRLDVVRLVPRKRVDPLRVPVPADRGPPALSAGLRPTEEVAAAERAALPTDPLERVLQGPDESRHQRPRLARGTGARRASAG